MPFYGDPYPGECWYLSLTPMSTGLFRLFTPEGFAIGADGLKRKIEDDGSYSVADENVQKIFPIKEPNRILAYSLTGIVQIDDEFDFVSKTAHAVQTMTGLRAKNLIAYVTRVCRAIYVELSQAKTTGRITRYPTSETQFSGEVGETIMDLYFDGYYDGLPSSAHARFFHIQQKLSKPQVSVDGPQGMRICGSEIVARLLFQTQDDRLAKYRHVWANPPTMLNAVESAKSYFRACSDPEALKIDQRNCSAIGGHIHIATITPTGGFDWVIPPKGSP